MTPRISYVAFEAMDEQMRAEMDRCARDGTPRPESSAVRAHVPAAFWAFADAWRALFREGVCDHAVKELCRVYVSRSLRCEYCGNQRSTGGAAAGLAERQYDDLLDFESSGLYDERQKAALAYAEAITWRLEPTDALWERLHRCFDEPQLVELGCFVALTLGQQSWIRLLGLEHREMMGATAGGLAPGFESREALESGSAAAGCRAR